MLNYIHPLCYICDVSYIVTSPRWRGTTLRAMDITAHWQWSSALSVASLSKLKKGEHLPVPSPYTWLLPSFHHHYLYFTSYSYTSLYVTSGGGIHPRAPSKGSSEATDSDRCAFEKNEDYYGAASKDIVAVIYVSSPCDIIIESYLFYIYSLCLISSLYRCTPQMQLVVVRTVDLMMDVVISHMTQHRAYAFWKGAKVLKGRPLD